MATQAPVTPEETADSAVLTTRDTAKVRRRQSTFGLDAQLSDLSDCPIRPQPNTSYGRELGAFAQLLAEQERIERRIELCNRLLRGDKRSADAETRTKACAARDRLYEALDTVLSNRMAIMKCIEQCGDDATHIEAGRLVSGTLVRIVGPLPLMNTNEILV